MANKRLSPPEIEEMKKMVIQGVYPEDIANHFHIAVSSVHNYKTKFKDQGLTFPSVKGKRPSNALKPSEVIRKSNLRPSEPLPKSSNSVVGVIDNPLHASDNNNQYKFIINGVSVEIASGAKYVNIGKDFMEIKF